jgi:hypothetical protein
VRFEDFWLSDQFISLSVAFVDIYFMCCFLSNNAVRVAFFPFMLESVTSADCYASMPRALLDSNEQVSGIGQCESTTNGIRPIIGCLPAWFRLSQCLRRYRDTRKVLCQLRV